MVDVELYGGKRGLLEHVRFRTLYAIGMYRDVSDVAWTSVRRFVFVCRGNICRSPYASGRARALGMPSVSFGLDAEDGALADPVASRNAARRNMDLSAHRSQRLDPSRISVGDLLIAFEPSQLNEIRRRCANQPSKVTLLGIWTPPVRPHVQDPFGRSDRYFEECFSVIDRNVCELVRRIVGRSGMSLAVAPKRNEISTTEQSVSFDATSI